MTPRHRVSRTAIALIKRFEGYRRTAAQLPDGRWTIGHGHTLSARAGAEVSPEDAEALLLYDLIRVAKALDDLVAAPLTQNQVDALASFAFNLGLEDFRASAVLKRINEGALIQAACAMELWRKADFEGERIVVDALVRRRAAEKLLFLTPPGEAWVPAPSPILRPRLDTDAHDVVPRQTPAEITAALEGQALRLQRGDVPPPPPILDMEATGPTTTAAEAVTARLQTIFREPDEEAVASSPTVGLDNDELISTDIHPQADFAPPIVLVEEDVEAAAAAVAEPPFALTPPPEHDDAPDEPEPEPEVSDGPPSQDLFDRPQPANDPAYDPAQEPVAEPADGLASEAPAAGPAQAEDRPFRVIDDAAPYEFVAPVVRPLPQPSTGGLVGLAALAATGVAFFAGGVFWATSATPMAGSPGLDPRIVGWMAGIAGVGFFAAALFLMLERLGRASERRARQRR
jgi:lysozyme